MSPSGVSKSSEAAERSAARPDSPQAHDSMVMETATSNRSCDAVGSAPKVYRVFQARYEGGSVWWTLSR